MSYNQPPLQAALVESPDIALNSERSYTVMKGGQVVTFQQFPSTSFTSSGSQITISCNPPSRDIIVSRRVLLSCNFTIAFVGSGTGNLLQLGTDDGLRAYPLESVINSVSFQIGNSTVSTAPVSQYWSMLERYHNDQDSQDRNYSMEPAYPDQYPQYNDWKSFGSARNPLALQGENPAVSNRGGFPITVNSNSNTAANVTFTVTAPIVMSPFLFAKDDYESGLTGIQNMSFTAVMANLSRLWSHNSSANTISSYTVTLNSASLFFKYITPPPTMSLPKQVSWPYFSVVSYPTTSSSSCSSLASQTVILNTVQLDGIPRRLYIAMRKRDQDLSATDSDVFFGITALTVQFNNKIYLSSASQQQLYDISQKNGLNMSWPQFSQYCGSVICLNFGEDIGLEADEAPGLQGQFNLTITCSGTNLTSASVTPMLLAVAVYEGTFSMNNGSTQQMLNVLSKSDIVNAKPMAGVTFKRSQHVYGGNIFSSIWSGLKEAFGKAKELGKAYLPAIQSISGAIPHPLAQQFSKGVGAFRALTGTGQEMMDHGQEAYGGRRRKSGRRRLRGRGLGEDCGSEGSDSDEEEENSEKEEKQDGFGQYIKHQESGNNLLSRLV